MTNTATKSRPSGPSTMDLIVKAIAARKETKGSSAAGIKKTLASMDVDVAKKNTFINNALKRGVSTGVLKQVKGTGASGTFKLDTAKALAAQKAKAQKEKDKIRKAAAQEKSKARKAATQEKSKARKAAALEKSKALKAATKAKKAVKVPKYTKPVKKAVKKTSKPKKVVKPKKAAAKKPASKKAAKKPVKKSPKKK